MAEQATFTLDTSGRVECPTSFQSIGYCIWADLDPFTRGYVEALFADGVIFPASGELYMDRGPNKPFGFSDLAPETLAMILRDCEAYCTPFVRHREITDVRRINDAGRRFRRNRQERYYDAFPPLELYLGDDGKVRLREAA